MVNQYMSRPFTIQQKPMFLPYVCIQCGVGGPPREWFVDLGFSIDHYFDTENQAIYLCNECYYSMVRDINRLILTYSKEHEKWESGEAPTYTWLEERSDSRGRSDSGTNEDPGLNATVDSGSDRNDQDAEPNDSEPESTDSGDAESVDDSNSDGSTGISVKFGSE